MSTMTQAQKDYINEVILPTLIKKAIDGTLDSDMNLLSYHDFEESTDTFNTTHPTTNAIVHSILDSKEQESWDYERENLDGATCESAIRETIVSIRTELNEHNISK